MKTFLFIDRINNSICMVVAEDRSNAARTLIRLVDEDNNYVLANSINHVEGQLIESTI